MTSLPNPLLESSMARGGQEAPAELSMEHACSAGLSDEPLPLFLTDPSPEYLDAVCPPDRDLEAMLRVIFGF